VVMRTVNWVARILGFAALGVATFLNPPYRHHHPVPYALPVQIAAYCVLGLGVLAWVLIDWYPVVRGNRHRWLSLVLGVIAVASGVGAGAGGGGTALVIYGAVATLAAGSDLDLGPALAVTVAGAFGIEVSGLAFSASFGTFFGLHSVVIAGLIIGRNRAAYRIQAEQARELLAQRERFQTEERRADLLDERTRIAREIHDVLAHSLGALGIQIQAARAVLSDQGDIDRAREILAGAQRMASEGLVETRRAVQSLRADAPPLDEELARVSDSHAHQYGVPTTFDTAGVPAPLPPDATVALLRVAQESLVNAAKHAAGRSVALHLDYGDADVRLTVRNDLGPDAEIDYGAALNTVNGGYGLMGMRERLLLIDGTLEAGRRGDEWIVTAELPRPQPQHQTS
jgi:signal transduction histidine kinase